MAIPALNTTHRAMADFTGRRATAMPIPIELTIRFTIAFRNEVNTVCPGHWRLLRQNEGDWDPQPNTVDPGP